MQPPRRRHPVAVEPLESRWLLSVAEYVHNGSLEGGAATVANDWVVTGAFQADARFSTVHSGQGYAYLAAADGTSANNLSGSIYQSISIPASAGPLNLSFWTRITTSETTTTAANDVMTVQVRTADGSTLLYPAATLSNLDRNTAYVRRSFALPDSLKGQTVRLVFGATTNGSLPTTFRIDDVGLSGSPPDTTMKVVGYLPSYRQSLFSQVDLSLLTHINYFSISANADGSLATSGVSNTNLATVVNAAHARGVGVSITVGPQSFGTVAASAAARQAFAANVVAYCLARNLDGVDIDWEPPATGTNYANYALLIDALYRQTAPHGLKITAATNPWTQEIPVAATNQMDWVNVMCYDFDYANNSTYDAAIDGLIQWSDYGVEKHKLLMGTPFYGRSGTSWSNTQSKSYTSFVTEYRALNGTMPPPDVDTFTDAAGKVWYVNGVATIQRKMAFVRDQGYGGAMIWELGQDYWDASRQYTQQSLLPVIASMLRPPAWLVASPGATFTLVGKSLTVATGTVTFTGDASSTHAALNLTANPGASVLLNTPQHLANLTLSGGRATLGPGAPTVTLASLAITGTGALDINNGTLVLDYPGANSPVAAVQQLIGNGFARGRWNGATGILSSAASSDPNLLAAIGYSDNGDRLTIARTDYGDANLDGAVDADDAAAIVLGRARNDTSWSAGNFNYDSQLDPDDYILFLRGAAYAPPVPSPPSNLVHATDLLRPAGNELLA